jgi:hypothetical protein
MAGSLMQAKMQRLHREVAPSAATGLANTTFRHVSKYSLPTSASAIDSVLQFPYPGPVVIHTTTYDDTRLHRGTILADGGTQRAARWCRWPLGDTWIAAMRN